MTNLPAKQEHNLFTYSKNVIKEKVTEVENCIKKAKQVKINKANSFTFYADENINVENKDTIMYLSDLYEFEKPKPITANHYIWFISHIEIPVKNAIIRIQISTDLEKMNLLSNDTTQIISE